MTKTKTIFRKESVCWWQEVRSRDSGCVETDCVVTAIFHWAVFFELNRAEAGTIYWMELKYADGSHQKAPAIRLTRSFWEEQVECAPEYMDQLRAVDHAGETIGNVTDAIWLFFAG